MNLMTIMTLMNIYLNGNDKTKEEARTKTSRTTTHREIKHYNLVSKEVSPVLSFFYTYSAHQQSIPKMQI